MKKPDYMRGQDIYDSLTGIQDESQKVAEVCTQLKQLHTKESGVKGFDTKGDLYFYWWVQARTSGVIK